MWQRAQRAGFCITAEQSRHQQPGEKLFSHLFLSSKTCLINKQALIWLNEMLTAKLPSGIFHNRARPFISKERSHIFLMQNWVWEKTKKGKSSFYKQKCLRGQYVCMCSSGLSGCVGERKTSREVRTHVHPRESPSLLPHLLHPFPKVTFNSLCATDKSPEL